MFRNCNFPSLSWLPWNQNPEHSPKQNPTVQNTPSSEATKHISENLELQANISSTRGPPHDPTGENVLKGAEESPTEFRKHLPETLELKTTATTTPFTSQRQGQNQQAIPTIVITPPLTPPATPPSPELNPKALIHLIRHAQARHNDPSLSHSLACQLPDPDLTALGRKQCLSLRPNFPLNLKPTPSSSERKASSSLTYILTSPLMRAISTALRTFEPHLDANPNLVVTPWNELREFGDVPCNISMSLKDLRVKYDGGRVDLGQLWYLYEMCTHEGGQAIPACGPERLVRERKRRKEERALVGEEVRRVLWEFGRQCVENNELNADGNVEIAVVSHGNLLLALFGENEPSWCNAEVRTFMWKEVDEGDGGRVPHWHRLLETSERRIRSEKTRRLRKD